MKLHYQTPVAEELKQLLSTALLEDSGDGERSGYEPGESFDW